MHPINNGKFTQVCNDLCIFSHKASVNPSGLILIYYERGSLEYFWCTITSNNFPMCGLNLPLENTSGKIAQALACG